MSLPTIHICLEIAELEILTVRTFLNLTDARRWFDSKCVENSLTPWDDDEVSPTFGPCGSPIFAAGDDVHAALVYTGNIETSL